MFDDKGQKYLDIMNSTSHGEDSRGEEEAREEEEREEGKPQFICSNFGSLWLIYNS